MEIENFIELLARFFEITLDRLHLTHTVLIKRFHILYTQSYEQTFSIGQYRVEPRVA
jgi:hypothetical protein